MMFVIANPSPSVILTLTLNEVKGKGKNLDILLRVNPVVSKANLSVKSRFIGTTPLRARNDICRHGFNRAKQNRGD